MEADYGSELHIGFSEIEDDYDIDSCIFEEDNYTVEIDTEVLSGFNKVL